MSSALVFENVSKDYPLGGQHDSLRDVVTGAGRALLRRNNPQRPILAALHNVSFDVPQGQSFALIGDNGAGKTTALKVAIRVVSPTRGRVRVRGRVGALIEVGTGLHPDLTGRENIDLFGRIFGLTRQEVRQQFDAIIDFAEVGAAIDQPVKQFSSGMQLRLGFSIASHLEPDVLIVDEAIAVGDAGFQIKCVERMSALVEDGRTLIFVSHEMSAIEALCQRAIWLSRGEVKMDAPAKDVIRSYMNEVHQRIAQTEDSDTAASSNHLDVTGVTFHDSDGLECSHAVSGQPLTVRIHYVAHRTIRRPLFSVGISDGHKYPLAMASMVVDGLAIRELAGTGWLDCSFQSLPLRGRSYEIWGSVRGESGYGDLIPWQRLRRFEVRGSVEGTGLGGISIANQAPVIIPYSWAGPPGRLQPEPVPPLREAAP